MINDTNNLEILITTHDDMAQAKELSQLLINSRAAACVNIMPNIVSVFSWEGATQIEDEILMLIKTMPQNVAAVKAIIQANHTYDIPEIICLEAEVLHQPYMEWVRRSLSI